MRFITVLAASLAVGGAAAAPTGDSVKLFSESDGQIEFNPAMYQTENFTASDGETYEISFLTGVPGVEGRSIQPAFQRRQQSSDDPQNRWRPGQRPESCPFGSIKGDTGPNAPTTGRCMAIRDWCSQNPGSWNVYPADGIDPQTGKGWYPLVSSGKAGTTACHFGVRGSGALNVVGTYDVRDWAKDALDRYSREFSGVHRVRASGSTSASNPCDGVRPGSLQWKLDTLQGIQAGA